MFHSLVIFLNDFLPKKEMLKLFSYLKLNRKLFILTPESSYQNESVILMMN